MNWLRLYNEVKDDPKIQALRGDLFKFWINLLCLASEQEPRGTIPDNSQIAFSLRMRPDHVTRYMCELEACGLVDMPASYAHDAGIIAASWRRVMHNWEARQRHSDDAGKRKKAYREKTSGNNGTLDVPGHVPIVSRPKSIELELDPPLRGGGDTHPPPPEGKLTPVSNSPEDVDRVAATAERLFPAMDYGLKVRQLEANLRMDWLEAALLRTHDAGKNDWRYVVGTYRGIEADGGLRAKLPARASPPPPTPEESAERTTKAKAKLGQNHE